MNINDVMVFGVLSLIHFLFSVILLCAYGDKIFMFELVDEYINGTGVSLKLILGAVLTLPLNLLLSLVVWILLFVSNVCDYLDKIKFKRTI